MNQTFFGDASRWWSGALLVVVAALAFGGCDNNESPTSPGSQTVGSGRIVTESRTVQGFFGVSLQAIGVVTIERTGVESLTITADDNIMPLLTSGVSGGQLILGVASNNGIDPSQNIVWEVTARELSQVSVSGVGVIDASGVDTALFSAELTGVGDIVASGSADRQDVVISGVGNYAAPDLASREVSVDLTGVCSAVVRVSDRLEGFVGFTCTLEYFGDPTVAVTGTGTVTRLGP